jgi:hypothetical protein
MGSGGAILVVFEIPSNTDPTAEGAAPIRVARSRVGAMDRAVEETRGAGARRTIGWLVMAESAERGIVLGRCPGRPSGEYGRQQDDDGRYAGYRADLSCLSWSDLV